MKILRPTSVGSNFTGSYKKKNVSGMEHFVKLVNGNMKTKMIHFVLMISVMLYLHFMSMFPHHRNHSVDLHQTQ